MLSHVAKRECFSYFSMEFLDRDLTVKSITAVPRSKNFYNFYINGTNEKRSMKLKDLADFVTGLCPAAGGRARSMIYEFRPFYMEVETETLLELEELPEAPEPRRALLFGGVKSVTGMMKEEQDKKSVLAGGRRQTVSGGFTRPASKKP